MNKKQGDQLLCLTLLVIAALLWVFVLRGLSNQSSKTVTVDQYNSEITIEVEQGTIFRRTHEVKVNEFTYEEAQLLMQIAQAEAGNQGEDGMFFVMCCVINRARSDSPEWPDSIADVIMQPHQFYTAGMGKTEISPECHAALARIECGEIAPEIIAFERTTNTSLDKYFLSAFSYRDHQFYTQKK